MFKLDKKEDKIKTWLNKNYSESRSEFKKISNSFLGLNYQQKDLNILYYSISIFSNTQHNLITLFFIASNYL